MKRMVWGLMMVAGLSVMSFADPVSDAYISDLTSVMQTITSNISTEMAKHMGFYSGSGNVCAVNTSGFPGLKLGIGAGVNTTPVFWKMIADSNYAKTLMGSTSSNTGPFETAARSLGVIPFPYDSIYAKIGLPVIPLDVGVRLGFVPSIPMDFGNGVTMGVGQFHFGFEVRYLLFEVPGGFFKLDARLSYDNDSGAIGITNSQSYTAYVMDTNAGTSTMTTGFSYKWGGSVIGAKLMAGLNIPVVGSFFGGIGLDMNLGDVTTTFSETGTVNAISLGTLTVSNLQPYSAFDMRLIGGFNIFFIGLSVEYNIFSSDLAINFIPFQMAF